MNKLILPCLVLALILSLATSCGRPDRKKMPEFSNLTGQFDEGSAASEKETFIVTDTTINAEHFFCISVPDASSDSLSWAMLQIYKPLARILYDAMKKVGDKGVVINLCTSQDQQQRTDLDVKCKDEFSLPVVLIWDNASRIRTAEFINRINELHGFKCTIVAGNEGGSAKSYSTENCFQFPDTKSTQSKTFKSQL